jgi:Tripartite tricarboxylate transporter family receptor
VVHHLTRRAALATSSAQSMPHVAYRGGGLAVNDAVAGHVDAMIGSAALVAPHIAGGTLRALAQFGPNRLPALAQVQTAEDPSACVPSHHPSGPAVPGRFGRGAHRRAHRRRRSRRPQRRERLRDIRFGLVLENRPDRRGTIEPRRRLEPRQEGAQEPSPGGVAEVGALEAQQFRVAREGGWALAERA